MKANPNSPIKIRKATKYVETLLGFLPGTIPEVSTAWYTSYLDGWSDALCNKEKAVDELYAENIELRRLLEEKSKHCNALARSLGEAKPMVGV